MMLLECEIEAYANPVVDTLFGEDGGAGETSAERRGGRGCCGGSESDTFHNTHTVDLEFVVHVDTGGGDVGIGEREEVEVKVNSAMFGELPRETGGDFDTIGG